MMWDDGLSTYAERLAASVTQRQSRLCVGLDPLPERIEGDLADWLRRVIDETADVAAAYKPNIAFFEAIGVAGYELLFDLRDWVPADIPLILDAKRGDIADTAERYAQAYFEGMRMDAVTVNPLLGRDSIAPFLRHPSRGVYLLAYTSNPGAADFLVGDDPERPLWRSILALEAWGRTQPGTLGFVAGLTAQAAGCFSSLPDCPILIPGLGAQGGEAAALAALRGRRAAWLVNVSRSLLYPAAGAERAVLARQFRDQINAVTGAPEAERE
jgi:orotidine-5'-phosphate decarboxylase